MNKSDIREDPITGFYIHKVVCEQLIFTLGSITLTFITFQNRELMRFNLCVMSVIK